MTFLNEKRRFDNSYDFRQYVLSLTRPSWPLGSTFHNTFVPDIYDWNGLASMISMQAYYETKGWDRGPHLYIAKGAPNPNDDGIWVMTPPNQMGIHAGVCNSTRWGIEVVGDFQGRTPTSEQLALLADAISVLHNWVNIGADVNAHRDCMPGRTCPGDMFYAIKSTVVTMVDDRISKPIDIWSLWGKVYSLDPSARGFGIPQAWYANMQGPESMRLGAAESYPRYDGDNVVQLFEHGMIIYRNNATRIILYREFRVP